MHTVSGTRKCDKEKLGWHNSTLTIKDKEQCTILAETQADNYYFQLFTCLEILRPACHRCRYSNFFRRGDITLGDFWGIERKILNNLMMIKERVDCWKTLKE